MSKAFTKETDGEEEAPEPAEAPSGVRNLITPEGLERLRQELHQLLRVERPKVVEVVSWAAGNGDRSENGDYIYGKKRLRQIDSRIRHLGKRIDMAEPVDPSLQKNRDQVFFGATVTYVGEDDRERTVRIVGIDEADSTAGDISWITPVARALMRAREGDAVDVRTPAGTETLEVLSIAYGTASDEPG